MPYFVVVTESKANPDEIAKYRPAHYAFVEGPRNQGRILMAGRFVDGSGGMYILSATSREEAEAIVRDDPYHKAGVRTFIMKEWQRVY